MTVRQNPGQLISPIKCTCKASWEIQAGVNMAAAVVRVLSFSRNAKVLAPAVRLGAVSAHRYSLEVSSTGEAITHTGQVKDKAAISLLLVRPGGLMLANISLASVWPAGLARQFIPPSSEYEPLIRTSTMFREDECISLLERTLMVQPVNHKSGAKCDVYVFNSK